MTSHAFRVRVQDPLDDHHAERIYEGFDEDVGLEDGPQGHYVGFDREAPTFLDAVMGALDQLIKLGIEPLAVEDELVSMADIAERTGRSRQSVSLLVAGRRGPGGFPAPAAGNVRSPLWRWDEAAAWFQSNNGSQQTTDERSATIAAINGTLASRRLARQHPDYVKRIQRLGG